MARGTRDRKREQRHHPVGLDLEQPLQHTPGLARHEMPVKHQEAYVPILLNPKVGEREPGACPDFRADDDAPGEMPVDNIEVG